MDYRTFDRLAHHVGAAGSRRQALRAFLGAALVGFFKEEASAKPKRCGDCKPPPSDPDKEVFCCSGTHCSCNGECCNNRCFWQDQVVGLVKTTREFCCTGPDKIMCGGGADATCCANEGPNPCARCIAPSGLSGSYRRP